MTRRSTGLDNSSPGDALAVCDGRNDLAMLRWAGRRVAMGQAEQEVHDAADDSTLPVGEDGVGVEVD